MKIIDLIGRDKILPDLQSTSKNKIIKELAAYMAKCFPSVEESKLAKVLIEREGLASTAIGEGVAIPHGKLPTVDSIIACIGRAKNGVDFESMDGGKTFLFFVLVAPENSTGAHLKALARISRVFKDADFRKRLLAAEGAENMFTVIAEEDAKY